MTRVWACISVNALVHHPLMVQAQIEVHSLGSSGDSASTISLLSV